MTELNVFNGYKACSKVGSYAYEFGTVIGSYVKDNDVRVIIQLKRYAIDVPLQETVVLLNDKNKK